MNKKINRLKISNKFLHDSMGLSADIKIIGAHASKKDRDLGVTTLYITGDNIPDIREKQLFWPSKDVCAARDRVRSYR